MADEVRLCAVDDIDPGAAKRFLVGPHKIAVVRIGDDFYAIGDTCSHAEVSLSEGEVHDDTLELECWKHGSTFSLKTGDPSTLPATRPVPVYDLKIEDGDVKVVLPS
jgi:3-phenylpropionate/trans-cinnamate dioxygenase ferredoxin subunit